MSNCHCFYEELVYDAETEKYIPFKDTATINAFSSEYINNTSDVLIRMSDFTGEYLNDKKKEWLTKAILETIQTDETIPDNMGFDLDYENQQTITLYLYCYTDYRWYGVCALNSK